MEYNKIWVIGLTVISFAFVYHVDCGSLARIKRHSIQKRTILQMCGLIALQTGRSCLDFNGYGCFCGLGNRGTKPLDKVDTCCRKHDNCYGDVSCFWFYPQWVGYNIHCNGTDCQCTDNPEMNSCAYDTCRCDLRLSLCLHDADHDYRTYYQNYNRQLCNHRVGNDAITLH